MVPGMRVLSLLFLLASFSICNSAVAGKHFTILHTNDWQSRLLGFGPNSDYTPAKTGDDGTMGGLARMASLIESRRALAEKNGPVLVLDGGDFSMGTLFHTVTRETGIELQLLQAMGYDAVAVGNHEFDFKPKGFAAMIQAALQKTDSLPKLLMSNVRFDHSSSDDDALQAYMKAGILGRQLIVEKGGLRFGVIGLMGEDAADVAKDIAPLTFDKGQEVGHRLSHHLKAVDKVDAVILLSHGGVKQNPDGTWQGEDFELAQAAPDIDVVVGGHSHTALEEPLHSANGTPILQAGSDGRFLGEAHFETTAQGVKLIEYTLHPIDDSILGNHAITQRVQETQALVSAALFEDHGLQFHEPLGTIEKTLGRGFHEDGLGNLVTDAIRVAAASDIALTGNGTIRDEIHLGQSGVQSVADLFRVTPLGVGLFDDQSGYPLTRMYLTGADLKRLFEVLLLAHTLKGPSYYPRFSGAIVHYNLMRLPFDRVMDIQLGSPTSGYQSVDLSDDPSKLYSVGATSYVAKFAWSIEKLSQGVLTLNPLSADGTPIRNIRDAVIDADAETPGTQEIKEWKAFLSYIRSLPDTDGDGLPNIDLAPGVAEKRLEVIHSVSPANLLKNAGIIMWSTTVFALLIFLFASLYFIRLSFKFFQAVRD